MFLAIKNFHSFPGKKVYFPFGVERMAGNLAPLFWVFLPATYLCSRIGCWKSWPAILQLNRSHLSFDSSHFFRKCIGSEFPVRRATGEKPRFFRFHSPDVKNARREEKNRGRTSEKHVKASVARTGSVTEKSFLRALHRHFACYPGICLCGTVCRTCPSRSRRRILQSRIHGSCCQPAVWRKDPLKRPVVRFFCSFLQKKNALHINEYYRPYKK